jgi:hypothetical protein
VDLFRRAIKSMHIMKLFCLVCPYVCKFGKLDPAISQKVLKARFFMELYLDRGP